MAFGSSAVPAGAIGTVSLREYQDGPERWHPAPSADRAALLGHATTEDPFAALVRWLHSVFRTGKTTDAAAFEDYFPQNDANTPVATMSKSTVQDALHEAQRSHSTRGSGDSASHSPKTSDKLHE